MRIQYALLAVFFSLLTMKSYAQLSTLTPQAVSPTSGSTILTLQQQSCLASATAWQKLSELSEYYDDRASDTSGGKRDAWCEKYDAVKSALSGIETYYEASCSGELDSSDSSGEEIIIATPSVCDPPV